MSCPRRGLFSVSHNLLFFSWLNSSAKAQLSSMKYAYFISPYNTFGHTHVCFFIFLFNMSCRWSIQRRPLTCLLRLIFPSALDCNLPVKLLVFKRLMSVSCNVPISMQGLGLYIIRLVIAAHRAVTKRVDKTFINFIWFCSLGLHYFHSVQSRLAAHQRRDTVPTWGRCSPPSSGDWGNLLPYFHFQWLVLEEEGRTWGEQEA